MVISTVCYPESFRHSIPKQLRYTESALPYPTWSLRRIPVAVRQLLGDHMAGTPKSQLKEDAGGTQVERRPKELLGQVRHAVRGNARPTPPRDSPRLRTLSTNVCTFEVTYRHLHGLIMPSVACGIMSLTPWVSGAVMCYVGRRSRFGSTAAHRAIRS